jgi:hypothetical protein
MTGKANRQTANRRNMNGNLLITMFEGRSSSPDLAAILGTYWYALAVAPCVLFYIMHARSRKRHKQYRW